jgi:hypothetical protein
MFADEDSFSCELRTWRREELKAPMRGRYAWLAAVAMTA